MLPSSVIPTFDQFLAERGLRFEAVVVGGAALNLLGVVTRETRDCDILSPLIPEEILAAARDFAHSQREHVLREDWLNNGPHSLIRELPSLWDRRLRRLFDGTALLLHTLGREDLLKTKLFAFCDRRTDLDDCVALAPSREELTDALSWVQAQDANELWPAHVEEMFALLGGRLGHGL